MEKEGREGIPAASSEKIIAELAMIERTANDILEKLAQEKASLPQRINDEIARRRALIDEDKQKTLQSLYDAAAADADERIKQIEQDALQYCASVETAFQQHYDEWRATLFSRMVT